MTRVPDPTRSPRGAALLLVLAALVITVTACAALARMAATAAVADRADASDLAARQTLRSVEPILRDWLLERSLRATLPPDAQIPALPVFFARWHAGDTPCSLIITACDLRGAVPIAAVLAGSPLRRTLPPEVLALLDAVSLPDHDTAVYGLDLLAPAAAKRGLPLFPRPIATNSVLYGDTPELAPTDLLPAPPTPSLGTLLSTHTGDEFLPPAERHSRLLPPVRLNVNTAPLPLVEEALRLANRGGIELITQARAKGRPAPLPPPAPAPNMHDSATAPELVGSSDLWAFRIDARHGIVHRSVWAVYLRTAADWECIQRLAVTD